MPDVVLVHRISGLPRASFRFHLAMDTLASGYALGATPCARDFHPLERAHAGRTKKTPTSNAGGFVSFITATVLLLTQEQLNRAALNYV